MSAPDRVEALGPRSARPDVATDAPLIGAAVLDPQVLLQYFRGGPFAVGALQTEFASRGWRPAPLQVSAYGWAVVQYFCARVFPDADVSVWHEYLAALDAHILPLTGDVAERSVRAMARLDLSYGEAFTFVHALDANVPILALAERFATVADQVRVYRVPMPAYAMPARPSTT